MKGPGSILAGITKLKEKKVYVTEDSNNVWMEYREYKWALDADGNPTDTPVIVHPWFSKLVRNST